MENAQLRNAYHDDFIPADAWVQVRIAQSYLISGYLDKAEKHLKNGLAQAPNYTLALECLAEVYQRKGELLAARSAVETAMHSSFEPSLLLRLASIEAAEENFDEASKLSEQARNLFERSVEDGTYGSVRHTAMKMLDEQVRLSRMLDAIFGGIADCPDTIRNRYIFARALRLNQKLKDGCRQVSAALRFNTPADFKVEAAEVYRSLGHYAEAMKLLNDASLEE